MAWSNNKQRRRPSDLVEDSCQRPRVSDQRTRPPPAPYFPAEYACFECFNLGGSARAAGVQTRVPLTDTYAGSRFTVKSYYGIGCFLQKLRSGSGFRSDSSVSALYFSAAVFPGSARAAVSSMC